MMVGNSLSNQSSHEVLKKEQQYKTQQNIFQIFQIIALIVFRYQNYQRVPSVIDWRFPHKKRYGGMEEVSNHLMEILPGVANIHFIQRKKKLYLTSHLHQSIIYLTPHSLIDSILLLSRKPLLG